jgi:hypothetical protein
MGSHDHTMNMILGNLTPKQRSACGWPDPEPPKTMTWGEALAALKDGKRVRRQGKPYWIAGLQFNSDGALRCDSGDAPVMTRQDFDATDWEVVVP